MKFFLIIILFISVIEKTFTQVITEKQIENELINSYKKILDCRFGDTFEWDSLEHLNKKFSNSIKEYTWKYSNTIDSKFDSLKSKYIYIVDSDDKLFRIYSWDTWLGGTMHDYRNIFQYKSGANVFTKFNNDSINYVEDIYIPYYSEVYTLQSKNKTYYLAISNGIYSTKDLGQSIKIFTIENKQLVDTVKLIKTKNGFINSIDIFYDLFKNDIKDYKLIKYDKEKKIIYIPVIYENGKITNRFILYKYTGEYFENIKK